MDNLYKRISDSTRQIWLGLNSVGRVTFIVGSLLLLIAAIVLVGKAIPQRTWSVLYDDLEPKDAHSIVTLLQKDNVPFKLENQGKTILVEEKFVYAKRLEMAFKGLPTGNVGYELFDKTKLGMTSAELEMNTKRALEGEMARTFQAMEGVEKASVKLVINPESTFLDQAEPSSGTVVLWLEPKVELSESQIMGAVLLLTKSVQRLSVDNVKILNGKMEPLYPKVEPPDKARTDEAQRLLESLKQLEDRYRQKIILLLEQKFGKGKISAAVTLEMDTTSVSKKTKTVTPVVSDSGLPKNLTERSSAGSSSRDKTGGLPYSQGNIPGYPSVDTNTTDANANNLEERSIEFDYNLEEAESEIPPGAIKSRSATVLIDTEQWDQVLESNYRQAVAGAIGAKLGTGFDQVTVIGSKFDVTDKQELAAQLERQKQLTWQKTLYQVTAAVVVTFFLLIVLFIILRSIAVAPQIIEEEPLMVEYEEAEAEVQVDHFKELKDRITKLLKDDPDAAVEAVRTWTLEDFRG